MIDLVKILRDMAAGRKNEAGDHWDTSWLSDAADYIEDVRKGEVYVAHCGSSVMYVGTQDECIVYKETRDYNTSSWKIHKLEDYGFDCYEQGIADAEAGAEY